MASETRRRKKTKGGREDSVIRISKENHARLKALVEPFNDERRESTNECLERILDATEALKDGQALYVVGQRTFERPEDARGEAIMIATRLKQPINWPKIAIVIGEDTV